MNALSNAAARAALGAAQLSSAHISDASQSTASLLALMPPYKRKQPAAPAREIRPVNQRGQTWQAEKLTGNRERSAATFPVELRVSTMRSSGKVCTHTARALPSPLT